MRRFAICTMLVVAATGLVGVSHAETSAAAIGGPTYLSLPGRTSVPVAINDAGDIAVNTYTPTTTFDPVAVVWKSSSVVQELGTLGGLYTSANDINAAGQVVGYSWTSEGERHAYRWDPVEGMTDLGPPGWWSVATAINDRGEITGWFYDLANGFHVAHWSATDTFTDLGRFGGTQAQPVDINEAGQIAANRQSPNGTRAVLWDPIIGVTVIPTLGNPAPQNTYAKALNDRGEVVGNSPIANGDVHAFRWKLGEAIEDLGTLGGSISLAHAINNQGRITGYSKNDDGEVVVFVKDPGTPMAMVGGPDDELASRYAGEEHWLGLNERGQIVGDGEPSGAPCCSQNGALVWDPVLGARALDSPPSGGAGALINNRGEVAGVKAAPEGGWSAVRWTVDTPTQVSWTDAEYARLEQISAFYGYTPTAMPKASVGAVAFILAFVTTPGPTPVTLEPAGSDTTQTIMWEHDEIAALERVEQQFALDDQDAMRFAVALLGYIAAIQGH